MASSSSSEPATDSTGKKITVISSDKEIFVMEEAAAMQSQILKNAMEDTDDSTTIPVSIVKGKILEKVIEYCKYHSKKTAGQLNEDNDIASTSAACSGDDDKEKPKMEKVETALTDDSTTIPVSIIKGKIFKKVIEYCKYLLKKKAGQLNEDNDIASTSAGCSGDDDKEKPKMEKVETALWDKNFIDVDTDTLYFLTQAANYLNIKGLLDLCCEKVADMIRGKKTEEIRIIFNIKNDFTPEEEQQIRNENAWVYDN